MAIPDYQSIMLPLLKNSQDQKEHSLRETIDSLANFFKLTEEERRELLPSGRQPVFENRVGWARTYLKKSGLLETTKRAFFVITERGLGVLKQNPKEIDIEFLSQFPEFLEFKSLKRMKDDTNENDNDKSNDEKTPQELLEHAYQEIRNGLADEVLGLVKNCSPRFLEKLVVELLIKMGYGGSIKDAGKAIGQSGDGGIDGIIKEDKLGLDVIYIQAKRWDGTVGRPEIHKFVGALEGQRARKGIFITTSVFSKEAIEYVSRIDKKIVLIDGAELAQFMIDNDIGVSKINSYEIKRIDSDYFDEN